MDGQGLNPSDHPGDITGMQALYLRIALHTPSSASGVESLFGLTSTLAVDPQRPNC